MPKVLIETLMATSIRKNSLALVYVQCGEGATTGSASDGSYTGAMRIIGKEKQYQISETPSAEALKAGAEHQATALALAGVATTGVRRGIYRFATHEEANAHWNEATARAIVENQKARERTR